MSDQIQIRRDTPANWAIANPILASGEFGLETTSIRFKIGDGVTQWNSLPYITAADRMFWVGNWAGPGTEYNYQDVVRDAGYSMVCTNLEGSTDRPSPQATGPVLSVYGADVTNPELSATTKQLIYGMQYAFSTSREIVAYRLYTYIGQQYQVYLRDLTTGSISYIIDYVATIAGWVTFPLDPFFIDAGGAGFQLGVIVTFPDPSSHDFEGPWVYQKPTNPTEPGDGEVDHARNQPEIIVINKTDDVDADRGPELATLDVGDLITSQGVDWRIQQVNDQPDYVAYNVEPEINAPSTGPEAFRFYLIAGNEIPYQSDVGFWTGNDEISGLYSETGLLQLVEDDNQYGIDVFYRTTTASADWEIVSPGPTYHDPGT